MIRSKSRQMIGNQMRKTAFSTSLWQSFCFVSCGDTKRKELVHRLSERRRFSWTSISIRIGCSHTVFESITATTADALVSDARADKQTAGSKRTKKKNCSLDSFNTCTLCMYCMSCLFQRKCTSSSRRRSSFHLTYCKPLFIRGTETKGRLIQRSVFGWVFRENQVWFYFFLSFKRMRTAWLEKNSLSFSLRSSPHDVHALAVYIFYGKKRVWGDTGDGQAVCSGEHCLPDDKVRIGPSKQKHWQAASEWCLSVDAASCEHQIHMETR